MRADRPNAERREMLRMIRRAALAGVGIDAMRVVGCAQGSVAERRPNAIALARIPAQGRLRVLVGEIPVELRRDGGQIAARSLQCTHMGCEVRWAAEPRRYLCPCHEGVFDEHGRVLAGPPPRGLDELVVRVEGDLALVEV